jgi:hypothetical protein
MTTHIDKPALMRISADTSKIKGIPVDPPELTELHGLIQANKARIADLTRTRKELLDRVKLLYSKVEAQGGWRYNITPELYIPLT